MNIKNNSPSSVLVLLLLLVVSCEMKDRNPAPAPQKNISAITQYEWLDGSDLVLLKSVDAFEVRNGIYNISMYKTDDAIGFLACLWSEECFSGLNINMAAINNPIVRLKIAQLLIQNNVENPEYFNYIKKYLDSNDLVVRTVAVEALRDVYKPDALNLLRKIAETDDDKAIVDIALSGLKHQAIFGGNRDLAKKLWSEIRVSGLVDEGLIKKYNQMYKEYLQTRDNLKKQSGSP